MGREGLNFYRCLAELLSRHIKIQSFVLISLSFLFLLTLKNVIILTLTLTLIELKFGTRATAVEDLWSHDHVFMQN